MDSSSTVFPRLLVVLDESALALSTARLAIKLAGPLRAELLFLVAIPSEMVAANGALALDYALREHSEAARQRAAPWFEAATAMAAQSGIAAQTQLTLDEEACAAVLRIAATHHCAMIVAGSHGRGTVGRLLHGSLAADLVRHSPLPVVLCREDMPGLSPADQAPLSTG